MNLNTNILKSSEELYKDKGKSQPEEIHLELSWLISKIDYQQLVEID